MNTVTTANKHDDIGKLILRVALSVLILFHGIAKISGGVGFITGVVAKAGLPASLGYLALALTGIDPPLLMEIDP